MHNPPRFMTTEVLAAVLAEFEWPERYILEAEFPDDIAVVFPKCTLFFQESFENEMELCFSTENPGLDRDLRLREVLSAMSSVRGTPGRLNPFAPMASLDTVKHGIRDLCTLILTHFRPSLLGDFRWVEKYKASKVR